MKSYLTRTAAVFTICGALLASSVPAYAGFSYQPVTGDSTEFDKYLVMDLDATTPNASFDFTVSPGAYREATNSSFEVLPGVGTPGIENAVFSPEDVLSTSQADESIVTLKAGQGFVKKTVTVDFSKCEFKEPGVYRYLIRENGSNMAVTNDANSTRTLDVYVTDQDSKLVVSSYVLHSPTSGAEGAAPKLGAEAGTADVTTALAAVEQKSVGYVNRYETEDLTIDKHVEGNQASHDQYFRFVLSISGAVPGTRYKVDLSGCDTKSGSNEATTSTYRDQVNPTLLTADATGAVETCFYLQNGQSVTICGLAAGTKYTVREDPEDYKVSIAKEDACQDTDQDCKGAVVTDQLTGITADTVLHYVNTRKGTVPTGLFLGYGGSCAVLLVLAGLMLVSIRRRLRSRVDDVS